MLDRKAVAMSASLLVFIPPVLLALVLLLCFVGCVLDTEGAPGQPGPEPSGPPFTQYSTVTVLPTRGLVSYWPLGEPAGAATAFDLKSGHDGSYLSHEFPDEPDIQSAAAPGTFTLGNAGLVQGDTVNNDPSTITTCMQTNGGFVSVPFDAALIPTKAEGFTLEAWVRVEWGPTDTAAFRVVMTTFDSAGGLTGFTLFATPDNHWAVAVGNGTDLTQTIGAAVGFETTSHLVATYDGSDLILYLNGEQSSETTPADYHPVTANALFIGAGRPDLPEPHFPFVGKMQCVALYKVALTPDEVLKHFHNGNGTDP
jgi:Concanavalin A-like lectin/glucanases superfamily